MYEWDGKIKEDSEHRLMIKSLDDLFSELGKFVKSVYVHCAIFCNTANSHFYATRRQNHPYGVPEVIALWV